MRGVSSGSQSGAARKNERLQIGVQRFESEAGRFGFVQAVEIVQVVMRPRALIVTRAKRFREKTIVDYGQLEFRRIERAARTSFGAAGDEVRWLVHVDPDSVEGKAFWSAFEACSESHDFVGPPLLSRTAEKVGERCC